MDLLVSTRDEDTESDLKRAVLEEKVTQGITQLHVDSTVEGVELPEHQLGLIQLVLNLSPKLLDRMSFDQDALRVILSFGGVKSNCTIPWSAIYFMRSLNRFGEQIGDGTLFAESIPEALLEQYGLTIRVVEHKDQRDEEPPITRPYSPQSSPEEQVQTTGISSSEGSEKDEHSTWLNQLEKIDTRALHSHAWPLPLEEINTSQASSSSHQHAPEDDSLDDHPPRYNAWLEGEHTPERGLFSLRQYLREHDITTSELDETS